MSNIFVVNQHYKENWYIGHGDEEGCDKEPVSSPAWYNWRIIIYN